MKANLRRLCCALFALSLAVTLVSAQTAPTHIIVVIQENRTPDNLFHELSLAGADVKPPGDTGPCKVSGQPNISIALAPWQLDACFDPHQGSEVCISESVFHTPRKRWLFHAVESSGCGRRCG